MKKLLLSIGIKTQNSFDRAIKITKERFNNEKGAVSVEYGLLIALVVALVIGATAAMETPLNTFFKAAVQKVITYMG